MNVETGRSTCIGAGMCLGVEPELFSLESEGTAAFLEDLIDQASC